MYIKISELRQIIQEEIKGPQKSHWENSGSPDNYIEELLDDGSYYPPAYYASKDFSLVQFASLYDVFEILNIPQEQQDAIVNSLFAQEEEAGAVDPDLDPTVYLDVTFEGDSWKTDVAIE